MDFEKERIAELLKELKSGNKEVFEEFYKLTSPRAYFIALKIVRNEHDAEDILQESYIKLLETVECIDPGRNFMAWFYKIVANKSKDYLKKQKPLVFDSDEEEIIESLPDESPQFSPEENLNQDELCNEVMAAIDELTAEKRACIMMRYFGEMSVNEIAESLEVPVSTVKNRLFTARKDLKNKFEKNGSTTLYSAAPVGVIAWALGKSAQTVSSAFASSAASAEILAGVGTAGGITVAASSAASSAASVAATGTAAASTTTAATTAATVTTAAASTTASSAAVAAGTGIAAKAAALSVAQKIVIGTVTAGVIGGSSAGVATVVKNNSTPPPVPTQYIIEEVTTAPSLSTEYVFEFYETKHETETTKESEVTTSKREPTATVANNKKETKNVTKEPPTNQYSKPAKTRAKSTRRDYSLNNTTTVISTTQITTTQTSTTSEETEETTEETTTKPITTQRTTTKAPETTTKPETTKEVTTTQSTTQSSATLIIEVTDFDNNVVATITETVDAGTEITRDYLVALVSANGYEAMAGVYGDAIGTVAEGGQTYTFTAEL